MWHINLKIFKTNLIAAQKKTKKTKKSLNYILHCVEIIVKVYNFDLELFVKIVKSESRAAFIKRKNSFEIQNTSLSDGR